MDPVSILDHLRLAYPTMSAGALVVAGALMGWWAAWFLLRQEISTYKTRLEHAQDVIAGRIPSATYRPIKFRKEGSMIAGLALLVLGLVLAIAGTVLIFWNIGGNAAVAIAAKPAPANATPVAAPALSTATPQPRQFTDKTARELLALYDGRTPIQADPLITPYKGLWIRVRGQVLNVLPDGRSNWSVVVLKDGDRIIECRVDPRGFAQANKLNKDDWANLDGKISANQNGSQLYLLDCEFPSR